MESNQHRPVGLDTSRLPLWLAAGAFALFVFTLNRWVSILSLPTLVAAGGWDWNPAVYQPLNFLVALPLRVLPAAWQPVALNLLAAVCAAATLGLLARSVILLPQDQTRDQRWAEPSEHSLLSTPNAWLAPLFAVLVAGLQLTFWEHATAFSGEMLDLLIFAFCVWSVLEYRFDGRESRLTRLAFVYGLGVANNFALIAFLPAFVVALVWIRGRSFFRADFFLRTTGWGAAGLLLYLGLPLAGSLGDTPYTFWQLLKANLAAQKYFLVHFPRYVVLLLGLTSLLPVLVMGIRWPSSVGETSGYGETLAKLGFHLVHALFLIACVAVAFDPKFSPRKLGYGLPFLPFYFLGALSAGYFLGYFLAVFHPRAHRFRGHRAFRERAASLVVGTVVYLGVVGVPLGLIYRSLPIIQTTNGPALREFVEVKVTRLPASGAVLLADDPVNLRLVEAALRGANRAQDFVLGDTRLMANPAYQRFLAQQHPAHWPAPASGPKAPVQLDSPALTHVLINVARSNAVYYLQPSFGYYFEAFHLVPHGLVYELKLFEPGTVGPPPLPEATIRENAEFWQKLGPAMGEIVSRRDPQNSTLAALGRNYSLGLNHWAVDLQRAGQLDAAGRLFDLALRLNPDNPSAAINLALNENLRKGATPAVDMSKNLTDRFGQYRTWDAVLGANGPIDEPSFAFRLGQEFVRNFQYRQAAIQFQRAVQLNPQNFDAQLALASTLVQGQLVDQALQLIASFQTAGRPLSVTQQIELAKLEARAHFVKGDRAGAEMILRGAQTRYPQDDSLLDALAQLYLLGAKFKEALAAIDAHLKLAPDSVHALLNKGAVTIQL
ncbi:MAG TPA: DUF2723 domain-containing protein, partial [Verrucomicrobiae bacterium]